MLLVRRFPEVLGDGSDDNDGLRRWVEYLPKGVKSFSPRRETTQFTSPKDRSSGRAVGLLTSEATLVKTQTTLCYHMCPHLSWTLPPLWEAMCLSAPVLTGVDIRSSRNRLDQVILTSRVWSANTELTPTLALQFAEPATQCARHNITIPNSLQTSPEPTANGSYFFPPQNSSHEVWTRPISPMVGEQTSYALVFTFSTPGQDTTVWTTSLGEYGLDNSAGYSVKHLYSGVDLGLYLPDQRFAVQIHSGDAVMLSARVQEESQQSSVSSMLTHRLHLGHPKLSPTSEHVFDLPLHRNVGQGQHLDRDTLGADSRVVHDDNQSLGTRGHNLLLSEATSSALDQGHIGVNLICAIYHAVQLEKSRGPGPAHLREGLELSQSQAVLQDQLFGLEGRGHAHQIEVLSGHTLG
uniref:Uncharacterized protein n=1 Tax=Timema shepardi TaxID=629360 RepID=A0A7R9B0B4_TIMSH|nr:unnamed protein product [Timema shepardi]